MRFIETIKQRKEILSEIKNNDVWEFIEAINKNTNEFGSDIIEAWYKNKFTGQGIVLVLNSQKKTVNSIRILNSNEFSEFCEKEEKIYKQKEKKKK